MLSIHYIIQSEAGLIKAIADPKVVAAVREMFATTVTGAHVLTLCTLGLRDMYAKKAFHSVADMKGVKVRVQATPTEDAMFPAYGAQVVHMPFGSVYTSLQTGVVDTAENGINIYLANKHYEVAPIMSMTEHEANNSVIWVSDKVWNSLTKEQQGWVQEAADAVAAREPKLALDLDHQSMAKLQKTGNQVRHRRGQGELHQDRDAVAGQARRPAWSARGQDPEPGARRPVATCRTPRRTTATCRSFCRPIGISSGGPSMPRSTSSCCSAASLSAAFCLSVFLDIVTREIGHPWLWLQEATSLSFTYGIFLGAAAATRRNDHLYLSAMTEAMHGQTRRFFEVFNRAVVLACGLAMLIWGVQNVVTGLGNLRMPSMIPLSWWFAAIPLSGAFIALFSIEQILQGLRNGFARQGPA